jgi:peptidoglycan/xylan/chitin deacetylase (PgdA/CDA1 family)
MYHGLVERTEDIDHELVPAITAALFQRQLRHLKRHYRPVPASSFHRAIEERRRGDRFPVAVTFDDDLRSHTAIALPVLDSAGLVATFFLNGTSLHEPHSYWWERLKRVPASALSPIADTLAHQHNIRTQPELSELSRAIRQLPPPARADIEIRLSEVAGADPVDAGLRAADVEQLVRAGMEIGFHTLHHHDLMLLSRSELARAMREGLDTLEELAARPIEVIAYPYGAADAHVADAAREAGFSAGYLADHRASTLDGDRLLTGRVGPSSSLGGFACRFVLELLRSFRVR